MHNFYPWFVNPQMQNLWIPWAVSIHCTMLLYIRDLSVWRYWYSPWYQYPTDTKERLIINISFCTSSSIFFQLNSPHASKRILHSIFNKQLVLSHLPKARFAVFLLWIPIALLFLLNYHWSVSLVSRLWDGDTQSGILLRSSLGGQQAWGSERSRVGLQYCLCKDHSQTHGELWSYEDSSDGFELLKEGQGPSIPLSTSHWLWGPGARTTDSSRQPCLAVNCRQNEVSAWKGGGRRVEMWVAHTVATTSIYAEFAILCFADHVFVSWKLKIMSQTIQFLAGVSTVRNRCWGIPLQSSDGDSTLTLQRAWVQSLVRELRSQMPLGQKKKKKMLDNFLSWTYFVLFHRAFCGFHFENLFIRYFRPTLSFTGEKTEA